MERYPVDFAGVGGLAAGDRQSGNPYVKGDWVDEWGCVWSAAEDGVAGEVTTPPVADWSALTHYQPPWEVIRRGDWDAAQRQCEANRKGPRKFMRCGTSIRPFERLQFLRGSELLYLDLGEEPPELFQLINMVHEFFLEELRQWVKLDCDGIQFMDDWGSQYTTLISPAQWRRLFKPLYRDYCRIARDAGKKVFFHSDGQITDLYGDLIEVGVDAINSQLFAMDLEEVGRRFKGRITFWGEIDRQHVLPFGTVADVYKAVARVRRALDDGRGGVIAQCEWGINNPPANIAAVYEAWDMTLPELLAKSGAAGNVTITTLTKCRSPLPMQSRTWRPWRLPLATAAHRHRRRRSAANSGIVCRGRTAPERSSTLAK
jgi:hypothetical protein